MATVTARKSRGWSVNAATDRHPDLAVLIVNWNGWQDTIVCLESLLRSAYQPSFVVICDNASTDNSLEHIADYLRGNWIAAIPAFGGMTDLTKRAPSHEPFTWMNRADAEGTEAVASTRFVLVKNETNLGFAGGNNVGIRYIRRVAPDAFMLLLNNDTVVPPQFLSSAMSAGLAFESRGGTVLGFPIHLFSAPLEVDELCYRHRFGRGPCPVRDLDGPVGEIVPCESVSGCAMLIAPSVAELLLNERYFLYLEDADYCMRVRRSGQLVGVQLGNPLYHKRSSTVQGGSPLQVYYTRRSKLDYVREFYGLPDYGMTLVRMFFSTMKGVAVSLVQQDWRKAHAYWIATVDHLRRRTGRQWPA